MACHSSQWVLAILEVWLCLQTGVRCMLEVFHQLRCFLWPSGLWSFRDILFLQKELNHLLVTQFLLVPNLPLKKIVAYGKLSIDPRFLLCTVPGQEEQSPEVLCLVPRGIHLQRIPFELILSLLQHPTSSCTASTRSICNFHLHLPVGGWCYQHCGIPMTGRSNPDLVLKYKIQSLWLKSLLHV